MQQRPIIAHDETSFVRATDMKESLKDGIKNSIEKSLYFSKAYGIYE